MVCQTCGQQNEERSRYCIQCGSALSAPEGAGAFDSLLEARAKSLAGLGAELKSMDWAAVIPVRLWLEDKSWNLLWVRWLTFFAFFPMVLLRFAEWGISLQDAAWAFALYFALFWSLILHRALRPASIPLKTVLLCGGFTSVIGMTLLLSAQQVPLIRSLYSATEAASFLAQSIGFIFGVGLFEEVTKALPLYWLFIHKKEPTTPREAAFLGCISGLAFGATEAVTYSLLYASDLRAGEYGLTGYLILQMLRLISLPLLHALWAGVSGYFIGLAANAPGRERALIFAGVASMALLHGLYDLIGGWTRVMLSLLSLFLFVVYSRSAELIMANLYQKQARAAS